MFTSNAASAFKRIGFGACAALALALLQPSAAHAQVTWDAGTGTSGPQDGSGTWSTADANWWDGSTNVVWPGLTTSSAIIGANSGAAGTITASGSLALNAITFNAAGSGNYTLPGGTLGFAGSSPTITANTAATIGSAITSGDGLTKNGTGTLTLSGIVSNTSGGTATIGAQGVWMAGNTSTLTVAGGTFATPRLRTNVASNAQSTVSNDVTLAGNITVASGNGNGFRLGNGLSSGTYTLTGSNTFGAYVFTSANITVRIGGTGAAGGHNEFPTTSTAHHESENNS